MDAGHPCFSKILSKINIKLHKISYYLEKRDPDFEIKMTQVLIIHKESKMYHEKKKSMNGKTIISYDEKPGIQALENLAPDLMPVIGKHPTKDNQNNTSKSTQVPQPPLPPPRHPKGKR